VRLEELTLAGAGPEKLGVAVDARSGRREPPPADLAGWLGTVLG
jgi:hypothetical protein